MSGVFGMFNFIVFYIEPLVVRVFRILSKGEVERHTELMGFVPMQKACTKNFLIKSLWKIFKIALTQEIT